MSNFTQNNKINEGFIKVPKEKWKYELESGEITWEEHDVKEWLWLKANPHTGKVVVNYSILTEEMKERFSPYINKKKNIVNKITKIMNSLKKKQKLWFPGHSGSKKSVEVELAYYPLIQGGYANISFHFQQNSGRDDKELVPENTNFTAEVLSCEQRSKEPKNSINELESMATTNSPSRGPKKEEKDYRKKNCFVNNNFTEEEKELIDTLVSWAESQASPIPDTRQMMGNTLRKYGYKEVQEALKTHGQDIRNGYNNFWQHLKKNCYCFQQKCEKI